MPAAPLAPELEEIARALAADPARLERFRAEHAAVDRARHDLLAFASLMSPTFTIAPHLELIASKLPAGRGDARRLVIVMPPRHGKSELASRHLPAWLLGRDPALHIMAVSYSDELARTFGYDVRALMSHEHYTAIFSTRIAADARAVDTFRTERGGVYAARGVGGQVVGLGADVLILDDTVRSRADAESPTMRASNLAYWRGSLRTRLHPGASIVAIGTRWHEDDLLGRLIDSGEWDVLHLPALDDEGRALWPARYDIPALESIRSDIGEREWAAQYLGRPAPATGAFFKADWLRYYTPEERQRRDLSLYLSADFAYSAKATADYSVLCLFGVDADRRIYVLDLWRARTEATRTFAVLADWIRTHPTIRGLVIESDPGTSSQLALLKSILLEKNAYRSIKTVSAAGDKTQKAVAVQGLFEAGRIYLPKVAPWLADLEGELLTFPAGKHDDQVDALSLIGRALDVFGGAAPKRDTRDVLELSREQRGAGLTALPLSAYTSKEGEPVDRVHALLAELGCRGRRFYLRDGPSDSTLELTTSEGAPIVCGDADRVAAYLESRLASFFSTEAAA